MELMDQTDEPEAPGFFAGWFRIKIGPHTGLLPPTREKSRVVKNWPDQSEPNAITGIAGLHQIKRV
jgi:hypothetical protein